MADEETTGQSQGEERSINWGEVLSDSSNSQGKTHSAAAAMATLPELPLVVGRLPIRPDTKTAIVQLPEPVKGVSCGAVFANSSVASDCYQDGGSECGRPAVKFARPLNDREIEVTFWGSQDGKTVGAGWQPSGGYPGAQLETRSVEIGTPFVEVLLVTGRSLKCGCDSEKWASDEWGA